MSSILTNDTLTKYKMDELVQLYETPKFIKDDPIQFPHRYKKKEDIEIAAFISSLVSYGSRKQFNEKLKFLFSEVMNESPFEYFYF